jgi:nucleoid DNA-binding protein
MATGTKKAKIADVVSEVEASVEAGVGEAAKIAQLRIKELVDRVAASTEGNRKNVKKMVDSVLEELGKALIAGEGIVLPSLGRVRIVKHESDDDGVSMTLKLRKVGEKPVGKSGSKEALAEAGEAS